MVSSNINVCKMDCNSNDFFLFLFVNAGKAGSARQGNNTAV